MDEDACLRTRATIQNGLARSEDTQGNHWETA